MAEPAVSDPRPTGSVPATPPPRPGGPPPKAPAKQRRSRALTEWTIIIVVTVLVTLVIKAVLFQAFFIPSGSMEPTLKPGDRVLVAKTFYSVHRGDIVVFKKPPTDDTPGISDLIKRVIGLPGDEIWARGGHVYIDGRQLNEHWLPRVDRGVTSAFGPEKVPAGEYFVMGDNRTNSDDSRYLGPIPRQLIVGKTVLRIWPLSGLAVF